MALSSAAQAADRYTSGPEVLAARSSSIVTGPVEGYDRKVLATSQPPGPDAFPVKWVASGTLQQPAVIKGRLRGPVNFARPEQSLLLPEDGSREAWELEYGDVVPGGKVVVFIASDANPSAVKAIPTGAEEQDLARLVREVVAIQSRPPHELEGAWLGYLRSASMDQGRKAALRTLVQRDVAWKPLAANLDALMADKSTTGGTREFAFGIVVFALTQGHWAAEQPVVADFLCRQFEREQQPKLLLSYILVLKLALKYSPEQATLAARQPLRNRVVDCLKRREAEASRLPELAEQYRQLRAAHSGLF